MPMSTLTKQIVLFGSNLETTSDGLLVACVFCLLFHIPRKNPGHRDGIDVSVFRCIGSLRSVKATSASSSRFGTASLMIKARDRNRR